MLDKVYCSLLFAFINIYNLYVLLEENPFGGVATGNCDDAKFIPFILAYTFNVSQKILILSPPVSPCEL